MAISAADSARARFLVPALKMSSFSGGYIAWFAVLALACGALYYRTNISEALPLSGSCSSRAQQYCQLQPQLTRPLLDRHCCRRVQGIPAPLLVCVLDNGDRRLASGAHFPSAATAPAPRQILTRFHLAQRLCRARTFTSSMLSTASKKETSRCCSSWVSAAVWCSARLWAAWRTGTAARRTA